MAASRQCERGVRWKKQPQQFANKRLTSCAKLLDEIEGGSYAPQGRQAVHDLRAGEDAARQAGHVQGQGGPALLLQPRPSTGRRGVRHGRVLGGPSRSRAVLRLRACEGVGGGRALRRMGREVRLQRLLRNDRPCGPAQHASPPDTRRQALLVRQDRRRKRGARARPREPRLAALRDHVPDAHRPGRHGPRGNNRIPQVHGRRDHGLREQEGPRRQRSMQRSRWRRGCA